MKRRSPIKEDPLPRAGESLDRIIARVKRVTSLKIDFMRGVAFGFATYALWGFWNSRAIESWIFTSAALLLAWLAAFMERREMKKIDLMELGSDGERAVGETLEGLRAKGYGILHDIPGDGFNLDHVVVAPNGIFAVETKTRSKPLRGDARITYDGRTIFLDGFKPEKKPLVQAAAAASWLSGILLESTGKRFPVRPVVVYPGWFVEMTSEANRGQVWVLNPKALPAFIEKANGGLAEADMHMVLFHLSRFVRSTRRQNSGGDRQKVGRQGGWV